MIPETPNPAVDVQRSKEPSPDLPAIEQNSPTMPSKNIEEAQCGAQPDKTTSINDSEKVKNEETATEPFEVSTCNESKNAVSFDASVKVQEIKTEPGCDNQSESSFFGLPQEVLDEEAKLSAQEPERKVFFKSKRERIENTEEDAEEREKKYEKLMLLLGKSSHYANFIQRRIQLNAKPEEKATTSVELPKPSTEPPKPSSQSPRSSGRGRKRKVAGKENDVKVTPQKQIKVEVPDEANTIPSSLSGNFLRSTENSTPDTYVNSAGLVVSSNQPRLLVGAQMRPYQIEGLEWLKALYENAINGILADEMGLGKTIQVISLLCHLKEQNVNGPFLVIGPLSTLPNWMIEFANFAPSLKVILYHGTEEQRMQLAYQFRTAKNNDFPIVLTSYEIPLRDGKKFFSRINWHYIVVDEGHRLKNFNCLLFKELKSYNSENRLLLTGTPLQNNLTELWSLLNFLVPEVFNDLSLFESWFDFNSLEDKANQEKLLRKEQQMQIISKMHAILEPFVLRRMKADVNIMLPPKKELLVYAPLSSVQKKLYENTLDWTITHLKVKPEPLIIASEDGEKVRRKCVANKKKNYAEAESDDEFEEEEEESQDVVSVKAEGMTYKYTIKMTNVFMMLRKLINHPYLIQMPIDAESKMLIVDEGLVNSSGKLLVLDAMLPKLKANGHKVLLFSTFNMLLDLIEEYMIMRGYKYVRLDGSSKIDSRMENIKNFNSDPEIFTFLISTRAGGLGINLTGADTVFIFDSDWNPQVDLQAQDRCHRIGQSKPVMVYRLVTAGTVDERIVDRAEGKRTLEKLIVRSKILKKGVKSEENESLISVEELKEMLQSSSYKHKVHSNGFVFSDEEIDALLDRGDLIDPTKVSSIKEEDKKIFKVIDINTK